MGIDGLDSFGTAVGRIVLVGLFSANIECGDYVSLSSIKSIISKVSIFLFGIYLDRASM